MITPKDVYEALKDQLDHDSAYITTSEVDSSNAEDLTDITVDGSVDCIAISIFLNERSQRIRP